MINKDLLCIVHVGLHHTATSSFQYFLSNNKEKLNEFSIIYPQTALSNFQHSLIPGCFFPDHSALQINRSFNLIDYIKNLEKELIISNSNICILSSEVFTELLNSDEESLDKIFKALESIFTNLRLFLTIRNSEERALSQTKAKLRLSWKNTKHHREIFYARKLFHQKIMQSSKLVQKWQNFRPDIIIAEMNKENAVQVYLKSIIPYLNFYDKKVENHFSEFINFNSDIRKNNDNLPPAIYLILVLLGEKIFQKDSILEKNLNINYVLEYYDKLPQNQKNILDEIDKESLLNYLKLKSDNNDFDLFTILTKLNFRYSVYVFIKKAIDKIIEKLIEESDY